MTSVIVLLAIAAILGVVAFAGDNQDVSAFYLQEEHYC